MASNYLRTYSCLCGAKFHSKEAAVPHIKTCEVVKQTPIQQEIIHAIR